MLRQKVSGLSLRDNHCGNELSGCTGWPIVQAGQRKSKPRIFSYVLRIKNFLDAGERIDFGDGFVWAESHDAREAEGKAALVATRTLNIVEGNFEDDSGLDIALEAAIVGGVLQKILG